MDHVLLTRDDRDVAWLTLNRPEVRNAFNAELIADLTRAAAELTRAPPRAVVIAGTGPTFSAGADLEWMRSMKDRSREDNVSDARALSAMFRALDSLPCAVVGRIHGHAMGGGTGLVAICDVAVAADDTVFSFSEVKLGIAPAVISPFVVRKIGRSHARALFVTGRRFDAASAERIGLVHVVVGAPEVDLMVAAVLDEVVAAGPGAVGAAKRLPEMASAELDAAMEATVAVIADLRTSDEGQEGMAAFLEKRPPAWTVR